LNFKQWNLSETEFWHTVNLSLVENVYIFKAVNSSASAVQVLVFNGKEKLATYDLDIN
jgi:hypothetical protein